MVYVCAICMATQSRLWTLNSEHRKIIVAIASPAVNLKDLERLKNILLLACSDCTQQVQAVVALQITAIKGLKHLLSQFPSVRATQDVTVSQEKESAPDALLLEDEVQEDSLLQISSYMEVELEPEIIPITQDVKLECLEPKDAASDLKSTADLLNSDVVSESKSVNADQNADTSITTPTTQVDVKFECLEAGDAASDLKSIAEPDADIKDNSLNSDVVSESISVNTDQTAHNSITTVTYGLKNSSYLAIQCLQELADRYSEEMPDAARVIRTSMCVDDSLFGADTIQKALQQATPVTRYDPKIAIFTHGPARVMPPDHTLRGTLPPDNIGYGSGPASCVQNYQTSHQAINPMARLDPPPAIQGNAAHFQMYHSQLRPMNVTFGCCTATAAPVQIRPHHLQTLETLNGTIPPTHAQVTVPGGSDGAGDEQTDKLENSQPNAGPWYVQFLSEAEILAEREVVRSAPNFAEALHRCDACLVVFKSEDEKVVHDRTVHMWSEGGYSCGICGYCACAASELRAHASGHSTRFRCSYCPFRTPDESVIRRHYCTNMPQHKKAKEKRPRKRKPAGAYKCNECSGRFADEYKLQGHIERLHSTPSGPFTCEVCKKVFRNKYKYNMHMYRHKKQKERSLKPQPELFCVECVKEFETKMALKTHMQSLRHSTRDNWQYECDTCNRMFPNKTRVRNHIHKMHLNLKPEKYKCDQCPKEYKALSTLRRHKTEHDPAAVRRPHVCHLCAKAFTSKKTLTEHLLMHEGLRPHACPLCPATFTYSAALYTHNRLKHLKIKRNLKNKPKNKKTKAAKKSTN